MQSKAIVPTNNRYFPEKKSRGSGHINHCCVVLMSAMKA